MTQTRVNIKTAVNASMIRRERRAGRDVIIVPSATLPDDVVMNRIRYPAAEIEKSYLGLNGTPAPLGHPNIDGAFVSASDPQGMVRGFIGAWNENARREHGRVFLDKVIDVEYARQLEGGRMVLDAIEKGEPIHTSTGLYAVMVNQGGGDDVDMDATDIVFDHDAILIGEVGAATPAQGVGMLVNAKTRAGEAVSVINSTFEDQAERELDWAVESIARAVDQAKRAPLLERLKSSILAIIRGDYPDDDPAQKVEIEAMAVNDEQFKAMQDKVEALTNGIGDIVAKAVASAITPLQEQTTALVNAAKATEDAELAGLRAAIVKSNLMDEASAGELTLNAARALGAKAMPKPAMGLHNGFNGVDDAIEYDLPE